MYVILPWMVSEEENQKSKTKIEISMNEYWRGNFKIKNLNSRFKSKKDQYTTWNDHWRGKSVPHFDGFFDEILTVPINPVLSDAKVADGIHFWVR